MTLVAIKKNDKSNGLFLALFTTPAYGINCLAAC